MKLAVLCALSGIMLLGASATTQAENRWSNYRGVDTTRYQHRPHYPQNHYPQNTYPQHNYPQHYPNYPQRPPHHQHYPVIHNGISIQYQAPTTITQNSQSYSWVNGDPNTSRIESSRYTFISDWQRLGLHAPPNGTYWIFENGRYVLVPNR
ncbi:RcnB family protein [Acinetobacter sp. C_4_1]|uniref:RcnB family protein n=1 Tax=unclassified Acinetobacter TaxID=196816 RepID=UPI0021B745BC|nr:MULTISPECIES: RcnB family protein [unclassified Acinetobacter]MCT8090762.1 RcnB family protein [Acinetobacter sp. F_3_1]MCT8099190.1 RcnB family protein [Acinetobacter sp. C_3_1]MCT8102263.1 RcnB family protein [Acinetobacter sp. C_4_1]MCT8136010.1 RcnB family protein [Acinetobacter sp. T_3_1]